jgi:hypothetical protein
MDDYFLTGIDAGYMMPWSFLFATALIASALDAFSRRLFHPVVLTTWFFGLAVCASLGSWSIAELTAGAICLMTPHLLICSIATRTAAARSVPVPQPESAEPGGLRSDQKDPEPFVLHPPKPVSKPKRRAA